MMNPALTSAAQIQEAIAAHEGAHLQEVAVTAHEAAHATGTTGVQSDLQARLAISAYQRRHGLPVTGALDPMTVAVVRTELAARGRKTLLYGALGLAALILLLRR